MPFWPFCVPVAQPPKRANSESMQDALGQTIPADDPVVRIAQTIERIAMLEAEGSITAADYLSGIKALRTGGARQHSDTPSDVASMELEWLAAARALDPVASLAPFRGRILGPSYRRGILPPGSTTITAQTYLSGQKAKVTVVGQMIGKRTKPNLRLEIRHSSGKPVCLRPPAGSTSGCEWLPLFSARYEITIINKGSQPVRYTLISN